MLIERSERGESGGKSGTDAKNGRDGEREKKCTYAMERAREKVRGRERENAREYSSVEWGLRGARGVVQR